MPVDMNKPFKLIPDEVFESSPLLRTLKAAGLLDQNDAQNRAPKFQVFSEQAFAAQGAWGVEFRKSPLFQQHIAARNAIDLPHDIVAAIVAERRPLTNPSPEYLKYTTNVLRQMAERAVAKTNKELGTTIASPHHDAKGAPPPEWISAFRINLCGAILAMIDRLVPELRSGALPLSFRAPGFKAGRP